LGLEELKQIEEEYINICKTKKELYKKSLEKIVQFQCFLTEENELITMNTPETSIIHVMNLNEYNDIHHANVTESDGIVQETPNPKYTGTVKQVMKALHLLPSDKNDYKFDDPKYFINKGVCMILETEWRLRNKPENLREILKKEGFL
jgi:SepF-like predicted cell division protein (DUF552 family)